MRKDSRLQIIRRITQILSLVFFTGLFVLAFTSFQTFYTMLINHNFSAAKLELLRAPLGMVLILSLLFGRIFCGWFCAFGALNDFLYYLSQKLFKFQWRVKPSLDSCLKSVKYIILGLIIIFAWTFKLIAIDEYRSWNVFAQLKRVFNGQLIPSISWLIFGLITVGMLLIERFFCKYLCPLGAILAPFSKVSLTKISKPSADCDPCQCCSATCPMGLDLSTLETVNSGECIRCLECVTTCPRKNCQINSFIGNFNPLAYILVVIMVFSLINIAETVWFAPPQAINTKGAQPTTTTAISVKNKTNAPQPTPVTSDVPTIMATGASLSPAVDFESPADEAAQSSQPQPTPTTVDPVPDQP
jgi:NosR/NirI family nitrous oxide reductase transcriptional regulator